MRKNLIFLSLALIVLAAVFACPDKAQAGILQVTQNTAKESIAFYPELDDKGRVAWVQTDAQGSKNLYLNDGQMIQKLRTTADYISYLSMENGKIAWSQYNTDTSLRNVCLWDGQQIQELASTSDTILRLFLENDKIAWSQYNYDTRMYKVRLWDGQQIQELASTSDQIIELLMENDKIAWIQRNNSAGTYKICFYDGQQINELYSGSSSVSYLILKDGHLVWTKYVSLTGYKICLYDGIQIQDLISTTDSIRILDMENGNIAWVQYNSTTKLYKLFLYNGQMTRELASTTDSISDIMLGNNQTAWVQYDYLSTRVNKVCIFDGQNVLELSSAAAAGIAGFYNEQLVWRQGTTSDNSSIYLYNSQNVQTIAGAGNGNPGYLTIVNNKILYKSPDNELFLYSVGEAEIQSITEFVTRLYTLCLNRQPDQAGLDYWVNKLVAGQLTGAAAAQNFIMSAEFVASNVSDSTFLDIMYSAFFNRAADSGGKDYWQSQLDNGMSRLFVLSSFVNSPEFNSVCSDYGIIRGSITLTDPADVHSPITAFVNRFYLLCMDREPDTSGLNYWVDQLASSTQTGAQLAQGFVFSPEFTAKNLDNTGFITVMYRVFFDREPDSGGQTYWVGQLDGGTSRLEVLAGFVGSPEFAVLCSSIGIPVGAVQF